jgi:hypothetical protein
MESVVYVVFLTLQAAASAAATSQTITVATRELLNCYNYFYNTKEN